MSVTEAAEVVVRFVKELEDKLEAADQIVDQYKEKIDKLEVALMRQQSERNCYTLGEPLTLEEWSQLIDEPVIYNTSAGLRQDVARGKPFMENCVYLDPRPVPTLPEPEEEPLLGRLKYALVSSCECGTKTPEIYYHSELCKYRLLSEAIAALEPKE